MLNKQNAIRLSVVCFCLLYTLTSFGQSDPSGEKRVTGTYAITKTTIYTSPGNLISDATILVRNGLIEDVGRQIDIPSDAQVIQGDSLMIYPGFIDAAGIAGVCKAPEVEKPDDFDPSNPPYEVAGITPHKNVLEFWEAQSREVEKWRETGITISQLLPKGEMLPGKSALVLFGPGQSNNVIAENTGLYAHFDAPRGIYPSTTLGIMATWRNLYKNATLSAQHQEKYATTFLGIKRPEKDKVLEAFFPVIDKSIPVIFKVDNDLEVQRALRLQKELGFNMVLVNVKNKLSFLEEIKASGTSLVISLDLPKKDAADKEFEAHSEETQKRQERVQASYRQALALPATVEKENIPFAFGTKRVKQDDFLKNLRLMVAEGLSEESALAALTTHAAKITGIDKFAGTIEKGKWANLVITTDSLFKSSAKIRYVMVDGHLFDYDKEKKNGKEKGTAAQLEGKWNYVSSTPAGKSKGQIVFNKSGDAWKGSITIDDPEGSGQITQKLEDIEVSEGHLKFIFHVIAKGTKLTVKVKGDLSKDEFDGKMHVKDHGSYPFSATKEPDDHIKG